MDTALKIIAVCLTGAVLSMILRKNCPEFAFCVAVGCCVMAVLAAAELISPVVTFLHKLQQMTGLSDALLSPLLKTVAIGLLTQIAGGFCADAGEQSLSKAVELSGTLLALFTALPLANAVLQMIQSLMGG